MSDRVADIEEYLSLDGLRTRVETHQRFSEVADDVEAAVLGHLRLAPDAALLDVGSGTGSFLRAVVRGHAGPLVGCDLSADAASALGQVPGVQACRADAARLPFADAAFGAVTARHMLYHVPDPAAAVREAARVLSSEGVYIATVNHPGAVPGCVALARESIVAVGGTPAEETAAVRVHSDSLGGLIAAEFGRVDVHRHDNALVFESPEPLIRFTTAILSFHGTAPDDPLRPEVVAALTERARRWFRSHDRWRDPKGYVVCVARTEVSKV